MAWDDDKSTASDPSNPAADEQLTATEWDAHVTDQKNHSARHESGGSDEITVSTTQISAFAEEVEDTVNALLAGGADISLTYDDANDTLTIDYTGVGGVDVEDAGTLVVGDSAAINFGSNVTVTDDGDGTVTVDAASSTDTRVNVSDGGTQVVAEPTDINFGSNVTVTDDGDGTVTVDATASSSSGYMVNIPATDLQDGEEFVQRVQVLSGETLTAEQVGVHDASGTAPANLTVVVRDETNATTVTSQNSTGTSVTGSVTGAATVAIKIVNNTGGTVDASAFATFTKA